jgi:hypothetical protein
MKRLVFLLLLATPLMAQDDALLERVRSIVGQNTSCAVVYSKYPSGRPRLVVAGTDTGHFETPGELLLIRFPDAREGRGKVIDRFACNAGVVELSFVHLVDPKDIAVELHLIRPPQGITIRIVREKLVQIMGRLPGQLADLDGDGIPEIITGIEGRSGSCGWRGHPVLMRWRARDYEEDDRDYVGVATATVGAKAECSRFETPMIPEHGGQRYVAHFYRGRCASSPQILIDGVAVPIETPVVLKDGCHTLTLELTGAVGAEGWAFIEERP